MILDELSRLGRIWLPRWQVNKLLEKGVKIKTLDGRLDTTTLKDNHYCWRNGICSRDGIKEYKEKNEKAEKLPSLEV